MKPSILRSGCGKGGEGKTTPSFFDNLMTIDELLDLFKGKVPRSTIYQWIYRRDMPHQKIGKHLFFNKPLVEVWVERTFSK